MKSVTYVLSVVSLALICMAIPNTSCGQTSLSPYVGYNSNAGSEDGSTAGGFLIGVGTIFEIPYEGSVSLRARPDISISFLSNNPSENDEISQRNVNISGDFLVEFKDFGTSLRPYLGGGVSYSIYTFERVEVYEDVENEYNSYAGTGIGVSIIGGAKFPGVLNFATPFSQLRVTMSDPSPEELTNSDNDTPSLGNPIAFSVGLNFNI